MSPTAVTLIVVAAALVVIVFVASIRVIKEYERAVVFRLGRLRGPLGPGIIFVLPFFDKMVRVDLRVVTLTIPPQEVITRDNVTARVNAVVLFRVTEPVDSVMEVENHAVATSQIAQTTLRSVVGRAELDTLLAHRSDLNEDLRTSIAQQTKPWGVEVQVVEIKDVEIPEMMQRAMAREAEAERERRAKVISARGELQASAELRDAAKTLSEAPASLQLRYLQTLLELGADQNSTVVFPLPMDIIGPIVGALSGGSRAESTPAPSVIPPTNPPAAGPTAAGTEAPATSTAASAAAEQPTDHESPCTTLPIER